MTKQAIGHLSRRMTEAYQLLRNCVTDDEHDANVRCFSS